MRIVCATVEAAGQVLLILMSVQLRPVHDFVIQPVVRLMPPITFTPLVVRLMPPITFMPLIELPAALLVAIHAVPDIEIIELVT